MYINNEQTTGSFTFAAEGSSDPKSPYFYGRLSHPSAESGVTIGAGYDMGGRTRDQVKADLLKAGCANDLATNLAKGAGITGTQAQIFVNANRGKLVVSDLGIVRNLFAMTYPAYIKRANDCFDFHAATFAHAMASYGAQYRDAVFFDWEYLYPAIRVIAIDLVYQGFGKQKSGFGKPLHFCMTNNFDWIIDYIRRSPLSQYEQGRGRAKYLFSRKLSETAMFSNCARSPI